MHFAYHSISALEPPAHFSFSTKKLVFLCEGKGCMAAMYYCSHDFHAVPS